MVKRKNDGTFERRKIEDRIVNGIKFVKYAGSVERNRYSLYETVCTLCGKADIMPSYRFSRKSARCNCDEWKRLFSKPLGRPAIPDAASHIRKYYGRYQKSATERGLSFELTIDEFTEIIEKDCVYCGAPPKEKKIGATCYGTYKCNGIDRIDNNIGYTKANSVPCCSECNFCKGTLSKDEFLELVQKVYEHAIKNNDTRG